LVSVFAAVPPDSPELFVSPAFESAGLLSDAGLVSDLVSPEGGFSPEEDFA
jgi:hypothetical protein